MSVLRILLGAHLACALGAAVAFWVPAFAFKGGPVHRAAGQWFARLIYAAASTGAALALRSDWQTMWFVLYVLLIIVTPVQHGLAVARAGPEPVRVRSRPHAALNLCSMAGTVGLLVAAVVWQEWIYLTIMPVGFAIGLRNMSYASRSTAIPVDWEREHLTSMLTAGIAVHTALLVFGTSRSLGLELSGATQLLPWMLPALVGLPAIVWLRAHRR